ncbi:MAG: hypothetical protein LBM16_05915, partial [Clostridiales bacterium]|nr:hypothetical protein [Clostridiales bacterium]
MVEISEGSLFAVDGNTYTIEKFIGKGKGGYSYIAECNNEKYVFKQLHYEPCSTYTFGSNKLEAELRDYNRLKETGIQMPNLIAFDDENQRLVKNFIEGDT